MSIFAGLKVIDCASFIAAPGAATVLADFGADVVKVEPIGGDTYRNLASSPGQPQSPHNYAWMQTNRNKRGLALRLGTPEGDEVMRTLVKGADVFITNYPFPARRRLHIDHDTLGPLNERLVYASFTAYGEKGAEADKPGFDSNAWWARSGLMDAVRADSSLPPARSVPGMGDYPCAMALYGAIVTALYRRAVTGKGGYVSSHLMANGFWSNGYLTQARLCGAEIPPRPPREEAMNPLMNHYRTRDDRWLLVSLLNGDEQWPVFAARLGRAELIADPRFATGPARLANARAMVEILDAAIADKTLAEWRAILDGHGLTFGFVATLDDMLADPQMRESEVLVPFEGEDLLTVNSPFAVKDSPKRAPRPGPGLGEHSEMVLAELGFSAERIQALRDGGIVAG
jgi:crotonobetainyl-CoA:carnitine CoA-transferase CaiB-like acyl-CoA transferase